MYGIMQEHPSQSLYTQYYCTGPWLALGVKSLSVGWKPTSFCVLLLAIMYVRMYIYCDLHGQMKGSAHS